MRGYLLDTNAWIGLLKGHPAIAAGVGRAGIDALYLSAPGGRSRLAMVRDKRWERIEASLA